MLITHCNTQLTNVQDQIIEFLRIQPEINQKLIGIVARNGNLKFWFEPGTAFALKNEDQPVFFFAVQTPSAEFCNEVFKNNTKLQGTKASLDFVNVEANVTKTSLIMICDEARYRNLVNSDYENICVIIADPVIHNEHVNTMVEAFSTELSMDPVGSLNDVFSRGTFFIGKLSNEVAGLVFLSHSHPEDHICRITFVYTKLSFRGLGLAKSMVSYALEYAFNELSSKCILYVNKSNTIARNLYESIGFHSLGDYQTCTIKKVFT